MAVPEDRQRDPAAFESGPLEDLTVQDALVISALYAVEADTEKCEQLQAQAQKHPLFDEKPEDTDARVNKFANWMQANQPLKAVEAAARNLKPEHRKQAFAFAVEAVLAVKDSTVERQKILKTLAATLALDDAFVDRKLEKIQRQGIP